MKKLDLSDSIKELICVLYPRMACVPAVKYPSRGFVMASSIRLTDSEFCDIRSFNLVEVLHTEKRGEMFIKLSRRGRDYMRKYMKVHVVALEL